MFGYTELVLQLRQVKKSRALNETPSQSSGGITHYYLPSDTSEYTPP